ncbi:MAG TPA: ATP-binding cassette domain-containing protein [Ktedonobacteraceae bacterium]
MVEPEVAINVDEVSYTYEPDMPLALDRVSLQIHKGDFLALLGQNGAGKTTLAKTFNGLLRPTAGSVSVGGLDIRNATVSSLAARVGYCYQNPDHQIFNRTVSMEAAFGPRNLGLSPNEVSARVDHALELVGLANKKDAYPFLLGKGERQKLAVASVLAMGSPILVVDEPTTGLDLHGTRSIMTLLQQWNQSEERTIVIITHDLHIVAEYIPRTVVMVQGKIVADGPTRSILSDGAALAATGLKPPQITRVAQRLNHHGVPPDVMTVDEMLEYLHAAFSGSEDARSSLPGRSF